MHKRLVLTLLIFILFFYSHCSDNSRNLSSYQGIQYQYESAAETIAGNRTLGHFVYIKKIRKISEWKIKEFCIHYAKKEPSISTLWLVNQHIPNGAMEGSINYRAFFKRSRDSVLIERFDKY